MANKKDTQTATAEMDIQTGGESQKIKCGLIMPISKSQGLEPEHWLHVKGIICEALADTELDVRLVSESDDVGVIHKSIVQNIYQNDIVICDVSTHNANVMFELGLRLAFDKPTVIIKDDETPFSFDTQVIEHIVYKRSLHYIDIVSFKKKLKDKVMATIKQSQDPDFSTFLKHFTISHVSRIEERTVSINDMVVERLEQMQKTINIISRQQSLQYSAELPVKNGQRVLSYTTRTERDIRRDVNQFLTSLASSQGMDESTFRKYLLERPRAEYNSTIAQFNAYINELYPNKVPYPPSVIENEFIRYMFDVET